MSLRLRQKKHANEAGYLLVYVLAFFAFVALAVACALLWLSNQPTPSWIPWTVAVSGSVLALTLYLEYRLDRDACSIFSGMLFIIVAIFAGIFGAGSLGSPAHQRAVEAIALALGSGGIGIAIVAYTFRRQRRPDKEGFPNLLRQNSDPSELFEESGVQVWAGASVEPAASGDRQALILLQNCFDAERGVTVRLSTSKGQGAEFPRSVETMLGPGELHSCSIPVRTTNKKLELTGTIQVRGLGGERVRPWRAKAISSAIPIWLSVLLIPFGVLMWGGGLKIEIPASREPPAVGPLPSPNWKVLWQPEPHTPRARRSIIPG